MIARIAAQLLLIHPLIYLLIRASVRVLWALFLEVRSAHLGEGASRVMAADMTRCFWRHLQVVCATLSTFVNTVLVEVRPRFV